MTLKAKYTLRDFTANGNSSAIYMMCSRCTIGLPPFGGGQLIIYGFIFRNAKVYWPLIKVEILREILCRFPESIYLFQKLLDGDVF